MTKPTGSTSPSERLTLSEIWLFIGTFIVPVALPALVVLAAAKLGYLDPLPMRYGAVIYLSVLAGQVVCIMFGGDFLKGLILAMGVSAGGTLLFPGDPISCLWNALTALAAYLLLFPAFGVIEMLDELMSKLKSH